MTLCSGIVQTGHSGSQGKGSESAKVEAEGEREREREKEEAERMQCGRWRSERCEEHGR